MYVIYKDNVFSKKIKFKRQLENFHLSYKC